jgi:Flp pilus assembly protein TadD
MRKMLVLPSGTAGPKTGRLETGRQFFVPGRKGSTERHRNFRFVVTWASLKAPLELIETADPPTMPSGDFSRVPVTVEVDLAALARIDSPPLPFSPDAESRRRGRWQMVVPQMVRPVNRTLVPRSLAPAKPTLSDRMLNGRGGDIEPVALSSFPQNVVSKTYHAEAAYHRALSLQRSEQWDTALAAFKSVLVMNPEHVGAHLGAGICLFHMNRFEEALRNFSQDCVSSRGGLPLFGKAVALQQLRRFEEASAAYELLLASEVNAEEVLSNLITLHVETRDVGMVRHYSLALLATRPNSIAALQGLATVALENSDDQDAAFYCDRILAQSPGCLEAWHNFRIAVERGPNRLFAVSNLCPVGSTQ